MKTITLTGRDASGKNTVSEILIRNARQNGMRVAESGLLMGSETQISKDRKRIEDQFQSEGVELAIFRIHAPEKNLTIEMGNFFSHSTLQSIFETEKKNFPATQS